MLHTQARIAAWLTGAPHSIAAREPAPDPSGTAPGFDWNQIHPDPAGVPRPDLFYTLINAGLWLGIAAIAAGGTGALIAMALGPMFGSRGMNNGGRDWFLKLSGLLIVAGSFVSIGLLLYGL